YIEHTAGRFPTWLAPEQIRFITVNQTPQIVDFTNNLVLDAKDLGLRVSADNSNESVGKKIRAAELMKIPYTVVIGEQEVQTQETIPRMRSDIAVQPPKKIALKHLLKTVANEAKSRTTHTSM
ncbi:MAG: threonyl-tRNA synthetase, partial [Patescibacteria group bacterium]|nr:threonyl-tRNA synthetase [Patescibacteria group bacterium]